MQNKQKIIAAFLGVVLLTICLNWFLGRGLESTEDASIEAHTIPISPKVSGYLLSLKVADNQTVKKGDTLAEIDQGDYELKLAAAKASLAAATVTANNASVNAKRQVAMGQAGTQKDADNAIATAESAKATMENAKSLVALAQKDLDDTKITAPEGGTVTMRTAEQGGYYQTGQQLLILVGKERWVVANFKEVQIESMRSGQKVEIKVDGYPHLKLEGHVDSIQQGTGARFSAFPPENATGNFVKIVQRVPVKITIDTPIPDGVVLGPGLSVHPTVHTGEVPDSDTAKP